MRASDYPVTFGYLATWGNYTHRGEDRAMPTGVEVWVGSTRIGLSGNTGLSTGPHLHGQAGTDEWCQKTINPGNYWWKGDTVVHVGYGDQWGNFVIVSYKNAAGLTRYMCYAHLSRIDVKPGDIIKEEEEMLTTSQQNHLYRMYLRRAPDAGAKKNVGKITWQGQLNIILRSDEYKQILQQAKSPAYNIEGHAPTAIRTAYPGPDTSQVDTLTQANKDMQKLINQLSERPTKAEIEEYKQKVAEVQEDLERAMAELEKPRNWFSLLIEAIAERFR